MGCAGSRGNLCDEERILSKGENGLGFYNNSSERIDLVIRKHANGLNLNPNHMKALTKTLGVKFPKEHKDSSIKDQKPKHNFDHLKNFYHAFEVSDGYNFRDFLLAGLLLGHSPAALKADLIWDVFDTNADGRLTRANYVELFRTLADISLDRTPLTCNLEGDELKKTSAYLDRLRAVKAKFLPEIISDSAKTADPVSKEDFRKYANKPENSDLLTPSGIRKAIEKFVTPPPNPKGLSKEVPVHSANAQTSASKSVPGHTVDHKEPDSKA